MELPRDPGWHRCWLASRKMLVTVALANKMARIVWALLVKGGVYRARVAAAWLTAIERRRRKAWRNSRRDGPSTTRAFHSASSTLRVNIEVYNMSGTRYQGRTAAVGSVKRPSPERAATTGLRRKRPST